MQTWTLAGLIGIGAAIMLAAPAAFADVRESRDVATFTGVALYGSMDAVIRVGDSQSVTIIGDADDVAHVITEVDNGRLTVRQDDGHRHWGSIDVEITVPALSSYKISGSGDGEITGLDSDSLALAISGSGDIEARGRCGELDLDISGSGDVAAGDLECRVVSVSISGSGDAAVHATETVSVNVSGSGDVDLYGSPRLEHLSINGSGDINTH